MKRTDYCGHLRGTDEGRSVFLTGWVRKSRILGNLIFIDLWDREGIVQIVFDPGVSAELHEKAGSLRREYVIGVAGKVRKRPEGMTNPEMKTGEIEVLVDEMEIYSISLTPPFHLSDKTEASEELRLKYRFLDLRRKKMMKNLILRHNISNSVRNCLHEQGFIEVETPFFTRSTPEGARDFLVPNRIHKGYFYALAQSPQLYKQLMMVAGIDRYYQIARCFRDEDLRGDRQPEFTQIDLEMSFITEEDIFEVVEKMISDISKTALENEISIPLPRMTYKEAMSRYGTDKPDIRYGMEIFEANDVFGNSEFKPFKRTLSQESGLIAGINVKSAADEYSRKKLDELTELAKKQEAPGLFWIKFMADGSVKSSFAKYAGQTEMDSLKKTAEAEPGDLVLLIADDIFRTRKTLGALRIELARRRKMIPKGEYRFLWITEFPLFSPESTGDRLDSEHHPFTGFIGDTPDSLKKDPLSIISRSYDLVLNGVELGSGSIRIFRKDSQQAIFDLLGISNEEARSKFGFLLDAFDYGPPPHGGIALGLDRLIMIFAGMDSIRDVTAFPKTLNMTCPLTNSPAPVSEEQLKELGLSLDVDVPQ